MLGGDLPKDVAEVANLALHPVLLGRGEEDLFYTSGQFEKDLAALEARGVHAEAHRFKGGHEWGQTFLEASGRFLKRVLA